jgi:hypothetical protein
MTTWQEVQADAPDFAARVRRCFDAGTHKTIATLRRDGSPRISGTELQFADGQVTLGMMRGSMKRLDVLRDPRVALHSPTIEPPKHDMTSWPGDAKLAGKLVQSAAPAGEADEGGGALTLDITEAVLTCLGTPADPRVIELVVESWHPGRGWQRRTRG